MRARRYCTARFEYDTECSEYYEIKFEECVLLL